MTIDIKLSVSTNELICNMVISLSRFVLHCLSVLSLPNSYMRSFANPIVDNCFSGDSNQ